MMKRFVWITMVLFLTGFVVSLPAQAKEEMVKTACCGKEIKKADAKAFEYNGQTYYFCSDKCKEAFAKDPEKALKDAAEKAKAHQEACAQMHKDMAVDPICGMKVKKSEAKVTAEYQGQTYYFCCEKCKEAFLKEPGKYLQTVYICPMCPEVKSDKPGKCPKCGMDLQAKTMQKNGCDMSKCQGMHQGKECPMAKKAEEQKAATEKAKTKDCEEDCAAKCPGARKEKK